jgi:cytoskeletal protein RodZ
MEAILELFDTSAKRWLAVLVVSVLVSIVILGRAFMNALAPQENTVTAEQSTSSGTEEVQSRSRPAGDSQVQAQVQEESPAVERVSPFDNQRPTTAPKNDPVVHQQIVHQQCDYLRQLIAAGKLPKGFGNLTKEQVDDMENKGVTIN